MRRVKFLMVLSLPFLIGNTALGKERTIGVFVALCDNDHQGIVPVPAKIGNGEDPEHNLYWGCTEGLKGYFDKSPHWKLTSAIDVPEGDILRKRAYRHVSGELTLSACAYRGQAIKTCLQEFETACRRRPMIYASILDTMV